MVPRPFPPPPHEGSGSKTRTVFFRKKWSPDRFLLQNNIMVLLEYDHFLQDGTVFSEKMGWGDPFLVANLDQFLPGPLFA